MHIFRTPFPKNIFGGLLLKLSQIGRFQYKHTLQTLFWYIYSLSCLAVFRLFLWNGLIILSQSYTSCNYLINRFFSVHADICSMLESGTIFLPYNWYVIWSDWVNNSNTTEKYCIFSTFKISVYLILYSVTRGWENKLETEAALQMCS